MRSRPARRARSGATFIAALLSRCRALAPHFRQKSGELLDEGSKDFGREVLVPSARSFRARSRGVRPDRGEAPRVS